MQTLLVGLDGASWSVLDTLFERESVPAIRSIVAEGASAPLESQIPPWTPSAWPSLYTGKNPGKHGVFDFLAYDGYEWGLTNATHVREPSLWELLDVHDQTSVVVNVPVTHPARPFDGALVPGYMAPERPECHPSGVLETIREELGSYDVYPGDRSIESHDVDLERRLDAIASRRKAFDVLASQLDPDFGFIEFQQTDSICHARPGDFDALESVYERTDDQIERLLDAWEPDTVFLVSDHGIGEYDGYEFRINEFLRRSGRLETTTGGVGRPRWKATLEKRDGPASSGGLVDSGVALASRITASLAEYGLTVQRVGPVLRRFGLNRVLGRILPEEAIARTEESVDFPNSELYVRTRSECGVRFNVEGREPNGVTPRERYESFRSEIVSLLSSVTTPEGEPVFEEVGPREEYFDGPHVERAPDVVTVPRNFEHLLSTRVADDVYASLTDTWNHKRHGIFAAVGDGVDATAELDVPHVFDVCPTVLATFGVPRGDRMDGDVLDVVSPAGVTTYPSYEPAVEAATADATVEKRLQDMGYLE